MNKAITKLTLAILFCNVSPAFAVLVGPVYPAPGGNTWVNTGGISGADGLATWVYSGFDTGAFSELYFGLNQVDFGPLGAGLSGSSLPMSYVGAAGTTATWSVMSPYTSAGGPGDPATDTYPIEFRMTIADFGPTPWIVATTLGLAADIGVVVDNSAGSAFTLNWEFVADMGSGFIALNNVPQGLLPGGQTRSSFASGFYHATAVPEPNAFLFGSLVCFGLLGVRAMKSRKSKASREL